MTQLAFALFDLMYRALTEGLAATTIRFRRDLEQEIHSNEITQEALTSRRMAARMRSPRGPAAVQIGLQVIVTHATKVNNVETVTLKSFARTDNR